MKSYLLTRLFLQKILCAGECDLVDVLFHLVGSHADSVVTDFDRLRFSINSDVDQSFVSFRTIACHCCHAALADGISTVTDKFS